MSATVAPSRKACFTREFMKTVHLVPKSKGAFFSQAILAKFVILYPRDRANVSIKEPHPDEHASFITISEMA